MCFPVSRPGDSKGEPQFPFGRSERGLGGERDRTPPLNSASFVAFLADTRKARFPRAVARGIFRAGRRERFLDCFAPARNNGRRRLIMTAGKVRNDNERKAYISCTVRRDKPPQNK